MDLLSETPVNTGYSLTCPVPVYPVYFLLANTAGRPGIAIMA